MTKEKSPTADFKLIDLNRLHESPDNPRKRFDESTLNDLAASIASSGIYNPIIVRPNNDGYEIGAGHRRFRAAKIAGLEQVPCIIRDMNDEQFLELLVIENNQREDVHPLEEAEGYHALSRRPGYDVDKISERIGRSVKYVYDRMKLLSLTKKAQELFLADKFTAGHAIIIARLSPSDQALVIEKGLFEDEGGHHSLFGDSNDELGKACSLRELQTWIDVHIRFDRDKVDPMLFPETHEALVEAKANKEKIVPITAEHYVQDSARADERTIAPTSWCRADGRSNSKTCDYSVVGVLVVGEGRGQSMRVCINKEKCLVHWSDFHKSRERRAKENLTSSNENSPSSKERIEADKKKALEKQILQKQLDERWDKAIPELCEEVGEIIKKYPVKGYLTDLIIDELGLRSQKKPKHVIPIGKNTDDLIRYIAHLVFCSKIGYSWERDETTAMAKKIGFDIEKFLEERYPVNKPKTEAKKNVQTKAKKKKG